MARAPFIVWPVVVALLIAGCVKPDQGSDGTERATLSGSCLAAPPVELAASPSDHMLDAPATIAGHRLVADDGNFTSFAAALSCRDDKGTLRVALPIHVTSYGRLSLQLYDAPGAQGAESVVLHAPDGSTILPGTHRQDRFFTFGEEVWGVRTGFIGIERPADGVWTIEVIGATQPLSVESLEASPIELAFVDKPWLLVGEEAVLQVRLTGPAGAVPGARVDGVLVASDGWAPVLTELVFLDDGVGADGAAVDGVYTATFTPTEESRPRVVVEALHGSVFRSLQNQLFMDGDGAWNPPS